MTIFFKTVMAKIVMTKTVMAKTVMTKTVTTKTVMTKTATIKTAMTKAVFQMIKQVSMFKAVFQTTVLLRLKVSTAKFHP